VFGSHTFFWVQFSGNIILYGLEVRTFSVSDQELIDLITSFVVVKLSIAQLYRLLVKRLVVKES